MIKKLRIGTRSSQLALWQANLVKKQLQANNISCELVVMKSSGDLDLSKPVHAMSEVGVFTKTLDQALLNNDIDLAVHSMKDVPTSLTLGLVQVAVLKRGVTSDVLVFKPEFNSDREMIIATGSLRRRAQWLARYPHHKVVGLRGNVPRRLRCFQQNTSWKGAIFAEAGLIRTFLLPEHYLRLDWMIPAPAQGAIVVLARKYDTDIIRQVQPLNDEYSAFCTEQERSFLTALEGGCSAPIGAVMTVKYDLVSFKGGLFSLDGSKKVVLNESLPLEQAHNLGQVMARKVLDTGGEDIMKDIRKITQ